MGSVIGKTVTNGNIDVTLKGIVGDEHSYYVFLDIIKNDGRDSELCYIRKQNLKIDYCKIS